MAVASALSPRGAALLKTLRATFAALDDHSKIASHEVDDMVSTVVAHIRSWRPQIIGAERLVDLQLVPPTDKDVEIEKQRLEIETMRSVFVSAIEWQEHDHDAEHTLALSRAVARCGHV
jgi:hypothetical protein